MAGLQRYSDILESCAGMSPNVLADRLKRLEAEGLIERHYVKALPPRVDYSLTEKGWAVRPILLSLIDWGRQYMDLPPVRSVGTEVPTDFVVRTAPTFLFRPERAQGLTATMVVELADCDDCNTWSFAINDGHFYPRRRESGPADVRLTTTTRGFFRFIRGEAPPHECGELQGEPELAVLIQACFIAS
jgi:DNA-binding HxlR family transcriptional regulator